MEFGGRGWEQRKNKKNKRKENLQTTRPNVTFAYHPSSCFPQGLEVPY